MRREHIPDDLRPLAFEFFYWFSRFEFALKANRFLKNEEVGARAEPGWTKFIRAFEARYQISETGQKLIAANPRRQLVGEHELESGICSSRQTQAIWSGWCGSLRPFATTSSMAGSPRMTGGTSRSVCDC